MVERIGRYAVEGEVARGGAGVVYRGRREDGRPVAIKLLLAGTGASPLQRRRVQTEVQALLRLRHPHVVELLDAGEHAGVPYLVLEWIAGETLDARLERDGPLLPAQAIELVERLAGALDHCHAQGVLHRDLKPANVLLRASDGAPLLTDFGLSKDATHETETTLLRSAPGRWLGTPGYWPPEQARGELAAIGPRSDVYGLGALLYAALTGCPPQEGESLVELVAALERPPRPPSQRRPGLPAWLDEVCLRALSAEPSQRPPTAGALAHELLVARSRRPDRRPRAPWLVAGALIGLLAGGGLLVRRFASRAPHDPEQRTAAARALIEQGDLAGARALLDAVVAETPSDPQAWRLRGTLRARSGDPAGAVGDLSRALELDPRDARTWCNRGSVRCEQGDLEGGDRDFARALEVDPRCADGHAGRGLIRRQRGDLPGALAELEQGVALAPGDGELILHRGTVRLDLGDLSGALSDAERALALAPRLARAWSLRGLARQARGAPDAAVADLERALALEPQDPEHHYNLGTVRSQLGDASGAEAEYSRAIKLQPDFAEAHYNRALLREKRDDPGAEADWDRAIALNPRDASALRHRARLRARRDELAGALADYDRAVQLEPRDGLTLCQRAALLARTGRREEALADFRRGLELAPDAPWAAEAREQARSLEQRPRAAAPEDREPAR